VALPPCPFQNFKAGGACAGVYRALRLEASVLKGNCAFCGAQYKEPPEEGQRRVLVFTYFVCQL
jgi:hypothetical protein